MAAAATSRIRAVTYDYWDTLVAASSGSGSGMRLLQIERFAAGCGDAGVVVSHEELVDAFDANWAMFEEKWTGNVGQHTPADTVAFVCERVGIEPTDELRAALVDGFRKVGEAVPMEIGAGIGETLVTLHDAGVALGIVCDVGLTSSPTLRARLEGFGLLRHFDAWSFSDETGWFKPASEAYRPVLEALGVEPASAAHVGDGRRTDVAGALALGMTAVRFTGFEDRHADTGPEAHHVIEDHRSLPALLDL